MLWNLRLERMGKERKRRRKSREASNFSRLVIFFSPHIIFVSFFLVLSLPSSILVSNFLLIIIIIIIIINIIIVIFFPLISFPLFCFANEWTNQWMDGMVPQEYLEALHRINKELEPHKAAEQIIQQTCNLLNCARATIFYVDHQGQPVVREKKQRNDFFLSFIHSLLILLLFIYDHHPWLYIYLLFFHCSFFEAFFLYFFSSCRVGILDFM